ncbi:response regulator transcription factor [Parvicella tangerina]|uniref:Response regulator ArlR n=1 Tax=Parvicella tangerina TaxID=2829795 RepID=A0A916JQB8_9FLAO|nr:response regulator transcription factor [Parvicella tangerina]CAG5085733.1 Response regulator ArlR [Parvicella tangerina]
MDKEIKILLVEDDLNLGFVIQDNLKQAGYKVHLSQDGKEGLNAFNEEAYQLCLFDVMLPKKDGFSLAEDVRKVNPEMPIIFLTAKSQTEDKIKGFKAGADDYITKPFSMDELLLRIEALLKRSGGLVKSKDIHQLGKYQFNVQNYTLEIDGEQKKLTKKEAEILKILTEQKGKVVERELILNMVWGDDSYFNGRSLDVFITKLRKYLKSDESIAIKNIHGVGFSLED